MSYALLIDDDEEILRSASDLVQSQGLSLETASSWEEGIQKFRAYSPDLVISDYNLPGSEMGLSLLLKLARIRPSMRLILISGYLDEEDVAEIQALGLIHEVVRKVTPIDTARTILKAVKEAAARADEPTDWVQFASASTGVNAIDDEAFSKLDEFLKTHRLTNGTGK